MDKEAKRAAWIASAKLLIKDYEEQVHKLRQAIREIAPLGYWLNKYTAERQNTEQ